MFNIKRAARMIHFPVLCIGLCASVVSSAFASYQLQQTYLGENLLDQYGIAVAAVGDVDGDGFDDTVVGANVNDEAITSGGKVYFYRGGTDYPAVPYGTYAGSLERGYVGQSISGGGDLNGDGYADWIAGAPGGGPTGDEPGRAYVFLGSASPDAIPDLVLVGRTPLSQFGASVSLVGDLNGDGFDDVCVSAPRQGEGRVFVFFGSASVDSTADAVLMPETGDLRFGASLAVLPDDDSDGRDDLLVGVPKSSPVGAWSGAVRLFRGSEPFDVTADLELTGASAGDEFGSSLWAGEDLTGDGEPDVLVGAPFANVGPLADAGRAYVFQGGAALDSTPDLVLDGSGAGDRFGASVGSGFDWNADGAPDVAVGAPDDDDQGIDSGRVSVYWGGLQLDGVVDAAQDGTGADQHLGTSVAATGDLRRNGRGGLLVGGYNGSDNGRALLFGSDALPTAAPAAAPAVPARFLSPRPNPFNPRVALRLQIEQAGTWSVEVFDVRGRRVSRLLRGWLGTGFHDLVWDGTDVRGRAASSGTYTVRATNAGRAAMTRVTLVR